MLSFGLAPAAGATGLPTPISGEVGIVKVSEGCGVGWWRGPTGHCHPFNSAGGSPRGTHFACPPGMHVGADGHQCWPN
ncbi:GCG_CRPN prefix-to-repeats domain-containing protein [Methylocapsa sp. S129]|uniref:GCG_CRPN prefix-to-repeats domain-containing protein n=1 Tax=Methylocapsa sp. S129 TaxID=1641869 RepID=UPI00352B7C78